MSRAALDLTPRPGSAPLLQQVLAQASIEARLILRNGEQLLIAVVIPVIVLVGAVLAADRMTFGVTGRMVDTITPGVLALAVMSTAFTSLAIATGFERRYGVIKRLGASPLPRAGLLAGKVLALVMIELGQMVVIVAVAAGLGWRPANGWFAGLLIALAGTYAFAALGLALAGALRAEATLAAANLIYLLLMAGGAVVLPSHSYGGAGRLLGLLPSGALGDGMRAAFIDGAVAWKALLLLIVWGAIGTAITSRTFKWE